MKRIFLALALVLGLLQQAYAVVVYYQPTPYPLYKSNGASMPQDLNKIHIWDGWMNSYYPAIKPFQRDDKLLIGGWGDNYVSYLQMDLTGLPTSATNAWIGFYAYSRGDSSTLTNFDLWRPNYPWSLSMTYDTQPAGFTLVSSWTAGTNNNWWWLSSTALYNGWKNGTIPNYGVTLMAWNHNNNFDNWRSSRYTTNDGQRPMLALDITPTINLKMPLPGNHKWLVTTEAGGYDCMGSYDQYHADETGNYFSIDFSWRNVADTGATPYYQSSNIPVLAAAPGNVSVFYNDPNNGNYVVISHTTAGYTTRYLHLDTIAVSDGASVAQGATIGYMGNTGLSNGKHLHFGVRYNNSGLSSVSQLTQVVMDGWLLKSFQTECAVNASGVPTDWIRYYRSGNTVY